MRTYKTKKGYFYKEYKNGKTKRISKEEHQKLKKDTKKTVTKKTVTKKNKYRKKIKQRGGNGPLTTKVLSEKLLDKGKILVDVYSAVNFYRDDESWDSKCKQRTTVPESTCKKCNIDKALSLLYQCSYCAYKYHSDCTLWKKFPLKSTKGTLGRHAKGNINKNTDVCDDCFKFLTAASDYVKYVKKVLEARPQQIMILDGTFQVINQRNQPLVTSPQAILNICDTIEVGDEVRINKNHLTNGKIGIVYSINNLSKITVTISEIGHGQGGQTTQATDIQYSGFEPKDLYIRKKHA